MPPGERNTFELKHQCAEAEEMEFSFTGDDTALLLALETYGLSDLVSVYEKCNYITKS